MARQRLSDKKTKNLAKRLQLPIVKVLVRGGTGHRKDLFLEDGTILHYWPDGEFTYGNEDISRIWLGQQIINGKDTTIPEECRG